MRKSEKPSPAASDFRFAREPEPARAGAARIHHEDVPLERCPRLMGMAVNQDVRAVAGERRAHRGEQAVARTGFVHEESLQARDVDERDLG